MLYNFGNNPHKEAFYKLVDRLTYPQKQWDLELVCYCKPKECHADVLREFLIKEVEKRMRILNNGFEKRISFLNNPIWNKEEPMEID